MSGAQHDINSSVANILIFWAMYGGPAWSSLSHPEAAGLIRSLCTEQWPHRMMSCRWVRGICEGVRFGVRTCSVSQCCWNFSLNAVSFVGSRTSDDAGSHQTFIDYYQHVSTVHQFVVCLCRINLRGMELRGLAEACRWMLMSRLSHEYKDSAVKAFMWRLMLDLQLVPSA